MGKRIHVFFSGSVQGVGFRFTAKHLANKYRVKGWVRNISDGRVEMLGEGKKDDLDNFLRDLRDEFRNNITDFEIEEGEPQGHEDFLIRF